jgi:hypothetical protein
MGFACREELAIKGVNPNTDMPSRQYTHTINRSVLEMVWLSHPPMAVVAGHISDVIAYMQVSGDRHWRIDPGWGCGYRKMPLRQRATSLPEVFTSNTFQ